MMHYDLAYGVLMFCCAGLSKIIGLLRWGVDIENGSTSAIWGEGRSKSPKIENLFRRSRLFFCRTEVLEQHPNIYLPQPWTRSSPDSRHTISKGHISGMWRGLCQVVLVTTCAAVLRCRRNCIRHRHRLHHSLGFHTSKVLHARASAFSDMKHIKVLHCNSLRSSNRLGYRRDAGSNLSPHVNTVFVD